MFICYYSQQLHPYAHSSPLRGSSPAPYGAKNAYRGGVTASQSWFIICNICLRVNTTHSLPIMNRLWIVTKFQKMQEMGLEPTRHCCHRHLKPARLPIPPLLQAKTIVSVLTREVKSKIKKCSNCSKNKWHLFQITYWQFFFRLLWYTSRHEVMYAEVSELADEQD